MKKVLKITESQYKSLIKEQNVQLHRGYDKPEPSSSTRVDKNYLPPLKNVPDFDPTGEKAKLKKEKEDAEIRNREGNKYHFICNHGNTRKPKNSKDLRLTIERHSQNCKSCDGELREFCRSNNMVATLVTETGKYWDEYFILRGTSELPINGGHWDNNDYTYCVCTNGEEKVFDDDVYFIEEGPVIKQGYPQYGDKESREKQLIEYRRKLYEMQSSSDSLYETFDCSQYRKDGDEKDLWKYQQCITENLSMAVSVVPLIGTAASAILDFANGLSFLASSLWGEKGEETSNTIMAGISFLSIIPGFGEAKALMKIPRKSVIATTDMLKELERKQFVSMVKGGRYKNALSTLKTLEKGNEYSLAKYGRKNVNSVINNLKKIEDKDFKKYFTEFQKIVHNYEKGGLKRETLNNLMKKNDFVTLVKKYDDINKAIKSQEFKKMLINIGVQVGIGGGSVYLLNYLSKLEKEIKNRNFDPKKEKDILKMLGGLEEVNKDTEEYIKKEKLDTPEKIKDGVDKIEIYYDEYVEPNQKLYEKMNWGLLISIVDSPDSSVPKPSIPKSMSIRPYTPMGTTPEKELSSPDSIDENKSKGIKKIKVSESQFKKLFYLNEQEEEEEVICTPKFKQVRDYWIKPLIKAYNNNPLKEEKITENEYTVNINNETLCRYSFTIKTWDDDELTCIITDNNKYRDSSWVIYKFKGRRIAGGTYDTSENNKYIYKLFDIDVNGQDTNDGKIFKLFKMLLKSLNKKTEVYKKINMLKGYYTEIENVDYKKLTKEQTDKIYNFLNSNKNCNIYKNSEHFIENNNSIWNKFNTSNTHDDENIEKTCDDIRFKIADITRNCKIT